MVTEEGVPAAAGAVSEVPRRRASISAVVICGNEEAGIRECLASVAWCDEIVVVDSLSTDRTVEIARTFTPRVFERAWPGYVAQKNFAIEQATREWVFSLDADETCTPELRAAIERALENPGETVAFRVRRLVHYLGRWIRHCGWYPDWKTRLVLRGKARWEGEDHTTSWSPGGRSATSPPTFTTSPTRTSPTRSGPSITSATSPSSRPGPADAGFRT